MLDEGAFSIPVGWDAPYRHMPSTPASNYLDWYRHGPLRTALHAHRTLTSPAEARAVASVPARERIIHAGPVHLINVSPPAGAVVEPPVPEYALNLLLRVPALLRVGYNRRPRWLAVSPGSMLLSPPDTICEFIGDAPAHVLAVAIPKARVEEFTEHTGLRLEVHGEDPFRDPWLVRQLVRLWHALDTDADGQHLFADQVMRALLERLARRGATRFQQHAEDRLARERLANHTLRHLRDYVESNLADELDVTRMAEAAALSPAHFARAFTATVGMTPFRYVMTRRLARARELLERTNRSALEIALDVGFKTPSHFTSRFRQEFGVTPREVRNDSSFGIT